MHLDFETDDSLARRAALGLIILQMDEIVEVEFGDLMPAGRVRLYHSRIPSAPDVTSESLAGMAASLPEAARLLPAGVDFDAIGYACTSGATVLGEAAVARMVRESHPGARVTNPLSALKAACQALGVRRLGLVSPYVAEVSQALREALLADGVAVTAFGSFNRKEERVVARIAPTSVLDALLRVGGDPACEAVFASCTNLQAVAVLAEAERRLGKPVLASNQVLAWHMLRLAGVHDATADGVLWRRASLAA